MCFWTKICEYVGLLWGLLWGCCGACCELVVGQFWGWCGESGGAILVKSRSYFQGLAVSQFLPRSSTESIFAASLRLGSIGPLGTLDGPAIRNANRGDSRESIRRKTSIFIRCERFARIPSNLRFAIFSPTKRDSQKMGFSSGTLKRFARIRRFARICEWIRANRAI